MSPSEIPQRHERRICVTPFPTLRTQLHTKLPEAELALFVHFVLFAVVLAAAAIISASRILKEQSRRPSPKPA
jgi:hypothetical protein